MAERGSKTALIVGASDGIGRALATRLIADGWRVVGVSRSGSTFVHAAYVHAVLDVRATDYRVALAATVKDAGPLDACIYCAGVGELLDVDQLAAQRDAFTVNLLGAVDTFEVLAPVWLAAKRGHFVVLSSLADQIVGPAAPSYNASKAGVSTYFESLALALRPRGVAITNLRFGFVDTKMAKSPQKPFMITAEKAARVITQTLVRRPIRKSYPMAMTVLTWLLGVLMQWRVWWG